LLQKTAHFGGCRRAMPDVYFSPSEGPSPPRARVPGVQSGTMPRFAVGFWRHATTIRIFHFVPQKEKL
jgi:hypothetical protein